MIDFVIPSMGRSTLIKTLSSIQNQQFLFGKDQNWNVYVGFDGLEEGDVDPRIKIENKKFKYFYFKDKVGRVGEYGIGNAGLVRNEIISKLESSNEWIGFVDDDDTISPYYIDSLSIEVEKSQSFESSKPIDVVIFRMRTDMSSKNIIPPLGLDQLVEDKVGISFCVNKKFLRKSGVKFINDIREDYKFLMSLKEAGANIVFSPYIVYNVRLTEGI